jgi:hypothetical protein
MMAEQINRHAEQGRKAVESWAKNLVFITEEKA